MLGARLVRYGNAFLGRELVPRVVGQCVVAFEETKFVEQTRHYLRFAGFPRATVLSTRPCHCLNSEVVLESLAHEMCLCLGMEVLVGDFEVWLGS